MSSYHPTMKMATSFNDEKDDMYNVHGHIGNCSRTAILESLRRILSLRKASQIDHPITIADYGTADGQASVSLVNEIIDLIQKDLGKEQAIIVYYNDQPMNDFNRLSKVIQGNRQDSGLAVDNHVYSIMVPRTMFEQCLPNNSLDLAISSAATHYLSKKVCQFKNGVFIDEADDTEHRLMKEQAKADWRSFVISRGRELKPGGFLITMNASSDENDDVITLLDGGFPCLGSIVSEMARDGIISQEEYLATNCNFYHLKKPVDYEEPFTSDLPEVRKLGLELLSVESVKHYPRHPTFDIVDKDEAEKLEYSRAIVASVYPWMHHILYGGLSVSRTEDEKQTITEQFFTRVQTYAFDHSHHKPYVICTKVVIKKHPTLRSTNDVHTSYGD